MNKKTISNVLLMSIVLLIFLTPSFLASFSFVFFISVTIYVMFLNKKIPFINTIVVSLILGVYFLLNPPPSACAIFLGGLPLIISMIYALFGSILYFYNKKKATRIILFSTLSIFLFFLLFVISMPGQVPPPN